jgi:hypothetical protein
MLRNTRVKYPSVAKVALASMVTGAALFAAGMAFAKFVL